MMLHELIITRASVLFHRLFRCIWSLNWGDIIPGVPSRVAGNWGLESRQRTNRAPILRTTLENAVFREESFGKTVFFCFIHLSHSHTNAHAIRGRRTPKDAESLRNGSVHESHSFKVLKTLN